MTTVFSKWKEKLLDLGKGNPMINFKVSKSKTLEILYPQMKDVYHKITVGSGMSFYDTDTFVKSCTDKDNVYLPDSSEAKSKNEKIDKNKLVLKLSSDLKKNEVMAFNTYTKNSQILKNLKKVATNSLEEKGLNVIYMAFGFMRWTQKNDQFLSPIVLVPVQLVSNSVSFYEENEIVTNPTLIYKLKKELNVDFPEFNHDDDSTNLFEYLTQLESKFASRNWEIINSVQIGVFSFLKMNMYKDYEENESTILKNTNVTKLLDIAQIEEQTGVRPLREEEFNDYFSSGKEVYLHNVVNADSSQLEAIIKAKNGESFVLQGPPGTGKSQTITNLIAEFLYDGKKVLFVSEKLAALNVVYSKMKKLGLADYCLELHSYKTNKKVVIDELCNVLNKKKKTLSNDAKKEMDELIENKAALDSYCTALHTKIENINLTPYEIIDELERLRNLKTFDYIVRDKKGYTEEFLNKFAKELEKFYLSSKPFNYDYRKSCWYGYKNEELSYEDSFKFKNALKGVISFLDNSQKVVSDINGTLNLNIKTVNDIFYYKSIIEIINDMTFFDNNFFKKKVLTELLTTVKFFNLTMEENVEIKKQIDSLFTKEIYELDSKRLYLDFKNKYTGIFKAFKKGYKKSMKKLKYVLINKYVKIYAKKEQKIFFMVSKIKDNKFVLKDTLTKIHKLLSSGFEDGELSSWKDLEKQLEELNKVVVGDVHTLSTLDKSKFKESKPFVVDYLNLLNADKDIKEHLDFIQAHFDINMFDITKENTQTLKDKLSHMLNNQEEINTYGILRDNVEEIKNLGLIDFVETALDNNADIENLSKIFRKIFLEQYLYDYFGNNTIFRSFSRVLQNNFVSKYKVKEKLKFEIAKAEIISKLDQKIPSANDCIPGSQVSTLLREANKKRKQKPVRMLIAEITELIQLLKPCFLMSPLSVSTYLSTNECKFDVVIFDEASQIAPWDAIGSIYRAKQVIIVGDSKQMTPSNFFNSTEEI
ncbi:MAG: DUF4011 domain-containing protein [Clostridia bacterium]|nr:DUF4011 domain-containing protein [Clostridia bacterium]